jgi:uncharacterized membrane protein YkoI
VQCTLPPSGEMSMRSTIIASVIFAAVAAIPAAAQDTTHHAMAHRTGTHHTRASLASQAKISKDSAQTVALAQVAAGSTVKSSELEKEKGKLIYSFDITVPGQAGVEELNISAIDGSVVAHEHETAAKEASEAKAEKAEKTAAKKAWKAKAAAAKADTTKKP